MLYIALAIDQYTCKHVHGVIIIIPAWSGQKEFLFQHSSFNSWKLNRLLNSILVKCVNYVYYFLSVVNTWLHIYIFINTDSIFGEICIPFSFVQIRFLRWIRYSCRYITKWKQTSNFSQLDCVYVPIRKKKSINVYIYI